MIPAAAVPAYFRPGAEWDRMLVSPVIVGIAVMNTDSGPGSAVQPDYLPTLSRARDAGIRVLGYIDTANARRPMGDVLVDAERWIRQYAVDGFFLDQVHVTDQEVRTFYEPLRERIHGLHPTALTVANPGTVVGERFMEAADVIVDFEGPVDRYVRATFPTWRADFDRSRFWHIVHGIRPGAVDAIAELVAERGTGWAYLTDQHEEPSTPGSYLYDRLPIPEMWNGLQRRASTAGPRRAAP